MNIFPRKLKLLVCAAALLSTIVIQSVFAQADVATPSSTQISSVAEINHLLPNPTLISLHFKNTPVSDIFEELAKQAHLNLATFPKGDPGFEDKSISIDIDSQPFWMAVRAISKASKIDLSIDQRSNKPTWYYTKNAYLDGDFYDSVGSFLIVADYIQIQKNGSTRYPFEGEPIRHEYPSTSLFVSTYTDPKFPLIGIAANIESEHIEDENGHSLIPKSIFPFEPSYALIDSFNNSSAGAALDLSHEGEDRIALFKGYMRFLQLTKSITWEVPDFLNARGVTKTVICNGIPVHYTISSVTQTDNEYKVRLTISWDQPSSTKAVNRYLNSQLSFISQISVTSLQLLDTEGEVFFRGGYGINGNSFNAGNTINATFSKRLNTNPAKSGSGKPTKLVLEIPTELTEIKVPFQFTNLPLPPSKE